MLVLCGIVIAYLAGTGFLLGQLFFAHFTVAAMLIGVAGLATSLGAFILAGNPERTAPWARWSAILALSGILLDIADYYMYLDIPGNYYPWFTVLPLAACIAGVGYTAHKRELLRHTL